ncbi:MAG: DUF2784 domain-containing protein [Rhodococcus sp. (in: high G+C Gram-positive bacteria)]
MLYRALADLTVVVHLAFVAYVVVGGFIAWKLPRTIWLHAAAAAWGVLSIGVGVECPLTALESWARVQAGGAALPSTGFIDHYLTGVIYPDSAIVAIQLLVVLAVLVSWAGFFALRTRRRTALPLH